MKITVEVRDKNLADVVEIYLDKEGLAYLIMAISKLKESGDHAHFMTPAWGMNDLSEEKVVESSTLVQHLKVTLI